jgi:hypothetical protein
VSYPVVTGCAVPACHVCVCNGRAVSNSRLLPAMLVHHSVVKAMMRDCALLSQSCIPPLVASQRLSPSTPCNTKPAFQLVGKPRCASMIVMLLPSKHVHHAVLSTVLRPIP